jgi:hypothetical protein
MDIAVNIFTKDFPKAHFNITLPYMPTYSITVQERLDELNNRNS